MKKLLLASTLLIACIAADAQVLRMDQIPKAAAHAFRAKYPAAQQESWERVGDSLYEVGFFNAKKAQTAQFDISGRWINTETDITSSVPGALSRSIARNFPGFDVQIVYQVENPDGTQTYEAIVFKARENYHVTFSAKYDVISKEAGAQNE